MTVVTSLQKADDDFTQNDHEAVSLFNDFFVSVSTSETDDSPLLNSPASNRRLSLFEFTSTDVYAAIQRLN